MSGAGPPLTYQRSLMYRGAVSTAAPDLARAARLFHALSDETRLGILAMLGDGERCVCELQDALDVAQSRLSFHLRVLREAGLIDCERRGTWVYYWIVPAGLTPLSQLLDPSALGVAADT